MPSSPPNLVVLLSGGGRTLLNLQDRIDDGSLNARISLVIASRPCAGVDRARARGLTTLVVPGRIPRETLGKLLDDAHGDLVVLAGYLQLVEVPEHYRGKIINIHPALLPAFGGPGMFGHHVHEAVLKAGVKESGCTVHVVDDRYDSGPVLLQRRCPVLPGDTPDTLASRVFEQECLAYPAAIAALLPRA
ncbi:MAG: phosphoribosylglycinamide formyltransferase [Phycisphaerales bacterium]|nr:phosphoribosylglycinamide formyltransferase [Phycisphaerales bacterium]